MLLVPRARRAAYSGPSLLVPFHRLSGQGRAWEDFSCCPMPRAAFLGALAFELALRDPGWYQGLRHHG